MRTAFRPNALVHLLLVSMVLLTGCALPSENGSPGLPTIDTSGAQYTSAVQTVTGKLTEDAAKTPIPVQPTIESATATSAPTDTAVPTATAISISTTSAPTATSAPTIAPTATMPSSDPRANLGSPTFHEPFDDDFNWSFFEDEHSDMAVDNGSLSMTAFDNDNWDSWTITWVNGEDFYIEMTATPSICSGLDRYGIIFAAKQDASEGYLFGISCDGRYSLRIWDGDEYTRLVDWTASDRIHSGANQTNRLGVWKDDDTIRLYVNGVLLKEVDDESYDEGHMGVWIGSANTEDFTVKVDLIDWWDL